ncbi:MAG: hypothetical protein AAFX78_15850, partial [Cyanobacteria bacterium J06638_20]
SILVRAGGICSHPRDFSRLDVIPISLVQDKKINPQLKPLILGGAGTARATQNQGFSGFLSCTKEFGITS